MHDSNPSKLNFTWLLPNGNRRLGYLLNTTSSYILLTPNHSEDFGQVTCRAQNELGLIGECQVHLIMGGKQTTQLTKKRFTFFKKHTIFHFRHTGSN